MGELFNVGGPHGYLDEEPSYRSPYRIPRCGFSWRRGSQGGSWKSETNPENQVVGTWLVVVSYIFGIFIPGFWVWWSNLICAYFSDGLVKNHLHQLRLVVYPFIPLFTKFYTSQVVSRMGWNHQLVTLSETNSQFTGCLRRETVVFQPSCRWFRCKLAGFVSGREAHPPVFRPSWGDLSFEWIRCIKLENYRGLTGCTCFGWSLQREQQKSTKTQPNFMWAMKKTLVV